MNSVARWNKLSLALWLAWIMSFIVLEAAGLASKDGSWPPLTRVVRRFLPAPLVIGFLGWLFAHAVETYQNPED